MFRAVLAVIALLTLAEAAPRHTWSWSHNPYSAHAQSHEVAQAARNSRQEQCQSAVATYKDTEYFLHVCREKGGGKYA